MVDVVYKYQLKQIYYEYLRDDLMVIEALFLNEIVKLIHQSVFDIAVIEYCSRVLNNSEDALQR